MRSIYIRPELKNSPAGFYFINFVCYDGLFALNKGKNGFTLGPFES